MLVASDIIFHEFDTNHLIRIVMLLCASWSSIAWDVIWSYRAAELSQQMLSSNLNNWNCINQTISSINANGQQIYHLQTQRLLDMRGSYPIPINVWKLRLNTESERRKSRTRRTLPDLDALLYDAYLSKIELSETTIKFSSTESEGESDKKMLSFVFIWYQTLHFLYSFDSFCRSRMLSSSFQSLMVDIFQVWISSLLLGPVMIMRLESVALLSPSRWGLLNLNRTW